MLFISCGCAQDKELRKDSRFPEANISILENNRNDENSINRNIELGLPTDADSTDDYLIYRTQYVLSYNKNTHNANWVSWNLNTSWYGEAPRQTKFTPDPLLPKNIRQATDYDYKKSGFDRGHTLRSEERTSNDEDNISTFFYTNIMPQTPDLNRGVWLKFERYCQKLCEEDNKELYIIAGGVYHDGYGVIGKNIAIPDSCYKIVVVMERGERLKDVTKNTKVIAVMMPNEEGVRKADWRNYTTTIRHIEWSTGYDFLSSVPKEIQKEIEN